MKKPTIQNFQIHLLNYFNMSYLKGGVTILILTVVVWFFVLQTTNLCQWLSLSMSQLPKCNSVTFYCNSPTNTVFDMFHEKKLTLSEILHISKFSDIYYSGKLKFGIHSVAKIEEIEKKKMAETCLFLVIPLPLL